MPTGYTSFIADGIDFKNFVLLCSRAFGATVSMRDEPMDAPLPYAFEVSRYHLDRKVENQKEFDEFMRLSEEEIAEKRDEEFNNSIDAWKKSRRESQLIKAKYESMLEKVKSWTAPSENHIGLKNFMIEQIQSSIEFDCAYESEKPEKQTINEYKLSKTKSLIWNIEYHSERYEKEVKMTNERNQWLKELRDSLD